MRSKIQIAVACGFNSEKYTELLLSTIDRTSSCENEIEYILGISDKDVDKNYISNIHTKYPCKIIDIIGKHTRSSRGHGEALDKLFKYFDSDYGMFMDCDTAILAKNWDVKMKNHFVNNIAIVGCEYGGKANKYKNFPNAYFCMFKTDILRKINISFMPISRSHRDRIKINDEQANAFCRSKGDSIIMDTGWELPYKIKKNGYEGCCISTIECGSERSIFVKNIAVTEYQLDGELIATHIGRATSRNFMTDPMAIKWRMAVENRLKQCKL